MAKSFIIMVNLYIFNESSRAAVYGIGTYIKELTSALKDSGINVCIVHLRSNKPDEELAESDDIRHLYIPPPINRNTSLDWNSQSELYYRNVVYLLRLQIEETSRLVFHLNYNQNGKLADELKKTFACKVIATVHYSNWGFIVFDNLQRLRNILSAEQPDTLGVNLLKSFEEEKVFYSKANHIICLSKYMQDILCRDYKLPPSKITVIPNGLSDGFDKVTGVQFLRKKWNVPVREKIILFAGRMDEVKGLAYLLKAFREVLLSYPQSRLVIAGNGAYDKYTKESQNICTRITYTGMLDKPQLYEWYRMANVGVTPSLFEPFGYVAVEMMMHGLTVVTTATSGLNEVVDESCGIKVPLTVLPDSVEIETSLLAQKIVYLLQHPAEARRRGRNGRKRYLKEYASEVFRRNMLQLYKSLN